MAEVTQLNQIAVVGGVGSQGERGGTRRPGARRRPALRTERAIRDAASVMGIPRQELTPKVVEALTLILHEMDRIRWDLEISHEHEAHLERISDTHPFLPVLNRRAFFRELTKMAQHARATETPSTLIYFDLVNIERIKRQFGLAARDGILTKVAEVLVHGLREIDLIAELGGGEFGIILNLADEQAARDKAGGFANHFRTEPVEWEGTAHELEVEWGVCALKDGLDAAEMINAAERRARRPKSGGIP